MNPQFREVNKTKVGIFRYKRKYLSVFAIYGNLFQMLNTWFVNILKIYLQIQTKVLIRISKNAFKDSTKLCHLHKTLQPHRNFGLHIPDPCDGSDHCTPCPGHTLAHISFRNGIDVFYLLASRYTY